MSKIKVLDSSITNRISAGEVVEKPASIVKELVENSIDAKADRIIVEIVNGGIDMISVSDNGAGIAKDDLKLAVMPHATSKIRSVEDLNEIYTLGFRGEALASIASVTKLEIISSTDFQEVGSKLRVEGGNFVSQEEIAFPTGTKIVASNLFFNTPVRAKFLRRPKNEESDITEYMEKLIMAYPNICFKYIVDGSVKYNTMGSSLLDNIYTIYGKELASNLIEINYSQGEYTLTGYVGQPNISKSNRNYQTLFVMGRYVKNYMISSAVQNAYNDFLMKGKFPIYILNLSLPANSLDVNVHPNKLEVKFEKPNMIYSFFNNAISNALYENEQCNKPFNDAQTKSLSLECQNDFSISSQTTEKICFSNISIEDGISFNDTTKDDFANEEIIIKTDLSKQNLKDETVTFKECSLLDKIMMTKLEERKNCELKDNSHNSSNMEFENINETNKLNILGTIFKTYIAVETDNNIHFIDQHAAHERINYDRFMKEIENQNVATQSLLIPFILTLKDNEFLYLKDILPILTKTGFIMEEYGINTYRVTEVPYIMGNINLKTFFDDLFVDLGEYFKKPADFIKDMIATKACKASVKAGQILSESEIKILLSLMQNGVLYCPHGRPFVVSYSKSQFDKWFKRIV